jgi:hypothetical protein
MTPNMGGIPTFNHGSNPPNTGWNIQPGKQASTQVLKILRQLRGGGGGGGGLN